MPPVRAANTSKRTTPRKTAAVLDFDAVHAKSAKAAKVKKIKAFGKVWNLQEPNAMTLRNLDESETSLEAQFDWMLTHVADSQRTAFIKAAESDKDFGLEKMMALVEAISGIVYEIPSSPSGS